jgi:hypothetical protein
MLMKKQLSNFSNFQSKFSDIYWKYRISSIN